MVVTFNNSQISIDRRKIYSSMQIGDGWVRNVMNYEKDIQAGHTYAVLRKMGSKTLLNVDIIEYNEKLMESIRVAN